MRKCSLFRPNECIFALLVAASRKWMRTFFLLMNCKRCKNEISEYWKSITISIISENLSPIYQIASKKFSLKNSKIYKECMNSLTFCHPEIWPSLTTAFFFVTDCNELKVVQTTLINQLFCFLNLIGMYGEVVY